VKLVFPDGSSDVVKLQPTDLAKLLREAAIRRLGHGDLVLQVAYPARRLEDEDLARTAAELGLRGGVTIRVSDVRARTQEQEDAQRRQAEAQQQQASLMARAGGALRGFFGGSAAASSEADDMDAPPPTPAPTTPARPLAPTAAPRTMADIRRLQEEQEKREAASRGGNTFFAGGGVGSGTNIQVPDMPRRGPPAPHADADAAAAPHPDAAADERPQGRTLGGRTLGGKDHDGNA
jgi:hypothetical protein